MSKTPYRISAIHQEHHAQARISEQLTDRAVSLVGTPTFIAILLVVVSRWIVFNLAGTGGGFDPAPFSYLELSSSLTAMLLAVLILAAQRRDDRLATRRAQITLQAAILTEQKVSKLIDLMEELRRDLPDVRNRIDLDAIEMTASADHEVALKSVEGKSSKTAPG